jgi:HNH endonuclease
MKDIPGYEGRYACTEDGKIWSYPKMWNIWNKWLSQSLKNWYFVVCIRKNVKNQVKKVHRLVALTYLPNPNNYPVVRHLDNNKKNNHVSNLEWCTYSTNLQQAYDDGLCPVTERQRESARNASRIRSLRISQMKA